MRRRAIEATTRGLRVAVDLSFSEKMNEEEERSLRVQVNAAYGECMRAGEPGRLVLTNLRDRMQLLLGRISGIETWAADRHEAHFSEVFSREMAEGRLVYLTPDSGEVLDEVRKSHVYVVGGFVDRVAQKGVTLERARQLGVRTARLPLKEFVKLKRSDRLPINQVVQLLLLAAQKMDWAEAIKLAVPHFPDLHHKVQPHHQRLSPSLPPPTPPPTSTTTTTSM